MNRSTPAKYAGGPSGSMIGNDGEDRERQTGEEAALGQALDDRYAWPVLFPGII
jgi:hypothetical protein